MTDSKSFKKSIVNLLKPIKKHMISTKPKKNSFKTQKSWDKKSVKPINQIKLVNIKDGNSSQELLRFGPFINLNLTMIIVFNSFINLTQVKS